MSATNIATARGRSKATVVQASTTTTPPQERKMPKINEKVIVDNLLSAISFHRDALELEIAVSLLFFAGQGETNSVSLKSKKALRDVYARAGYDCANDKGSDYKTVQRRIGVSADLYVFLGGSETMIDWLDEATPSKQVNKIVDELKGYNFTGISSVQAYIGKPTQTRQRQPKEEKAPTSPITSEVGKMLTETMDTRREAEKQGIPEGRVIVHGAMNVVIPFEATYDDVMATAQDLLVFAKMQMKLPVEKQPEATMQH